MAEGIRFVLDASYNLVSLKNEKKQPNKLIIVVRSSKKGAIQMLKEIIGLITGVTEGKVCQRCGAEEGVKVVYVSSFSGRGRFIPLCPRCRALEAMIEY